PRRGARGRGLVAGRRRGAVHRQRRQHRGGPAHPVPRGRGRPRGGEAHRGRAPGPVGGVDARGRGAARGGQARARPGGRAGRAAHARRALDRRQRRRVRRREPLPRRDRGRARGAQAPGAPGGRLVPRPRGGPLAGAGRGDREGLPRAPRPHRRRLREGAPARVAGPRDQAGVRLGRLTPGDVPAAARLSAGVGWNQDEADWARLLAVNPEGGFAAWLGDELVGTATLVRHGDLLAWLGMVIVREDVRGRGVAGRLVEAALAGWSPPPGGAVGLDATELGAPVYLRRGFEAVAAIDRWVGVLRTLSGASPS